MWASYGDMAVAGLISKQSKCYASPPTAVSHILTHVSHAQEWPSVGLLRLFECRDYASLYWPVLERLMTALLVRGLSTAAAARSS